MRGCLCLTALVCGYCLLGSAELLRDPYKVVTDFASALAVLKTYRVSAHVLYAVDTLQHCRAYRLQVLGVARGSSESEIRKAYRQLAVRLHPDKVADSTSISSFCTSLNAQHQTVEVCLCIAEHSLRLKS